MPLVDRLWPRPPRRLQRGNQKRHVEREVLQLAQPAIEPDFGRRDACRRSDAQQPIGRDRPHLNARLFESADHAGRVGHGAATFESEPELAAQVQQPPRPSQLEVAWLDQPVELVKQRFGEQ